MTSVIQKTINESKAISVPKIAIGWTIILYFSPNHGVNTLVFPHAMIILGWASHQGLIHYSICRFFTTHMTSIHIIFEAEKSCLLLVGFGLCWLPSDGTFNTVLTNADPDISVDLFLRSLFNTLALLLPAYLIAHWLVRIIYAPNWVISTFIMGVRLVLNFLYLSASFDSGLRMTLSMLLFLLFSHYLQFTLVAVIYSYQLIFWTFQLEEKSAKMVFSTYNLGRFFFPLSYLSERNSEAPY